MNGIQNILKKNKGSSIVLYGLGTETERFINEYGKGLNVVGLLDGYKESGQQFGLPIISMQQVIDAEVKLIVVVARPGSCKVIVKQIREQCLEHGIEVFDVRGNDLLVEREARFSFDGVIKYTKAKLMHCIDEAEVISFDLFDTLLARKVLSYNDVFELMNCQLESRGILIDDFAKKRLAFEKELSYEDAPTLVDIYTRLLGDEYKFAPYELADIEWQIDKTTFVLREDMQEVLQYAKSVGKTTVLTSDSYYDMEQIRSLLEGFNIDYFDKLFVSCECGVSKTIGLYEKLVNDYQGKKILHIGDDEWADDEMATRAGINTFRIYSGMDIYDFLGGMELKYHIESISERVKLGLFISRIFNSPFQFEERSNDLSVSSSKDIGYLFCAPIITDFIHWMKDKILEQGFDNIFFCARDGYLLQKLYNKIDAKSNTYYFLTSRTAAIRAGMENKEDVEYVDSMKYFGSQDEEMNVRYGISSCNNSSDRVKSILERATILRENYKKYIGSLDLSNDNIAMFDFVAKGTTQLFLERLFSQHIKGFYFLQLEPEFMSDKGLDIEPFYSDDNKDKSSIYDNYYILETILTSPYSQVNEFDNMGSPIYADETRSEEDLRFVECVQEGIDEYYEDYLSLMPKEAREIDRDLDESFLSLFNRIRINNEAFYHMKVEDPFFGRMTDITDVVS